MALLPNTPIGEGTKSTSYHAPAGQRITNLGRVRPDCKLVVVFFSPQRAFISMASGTLSSTILNFSSF
jgi:hypothetical protein